MIVIKWVILAFLGLCSGFAVSAGVFAFITMLGIVPRLAARTHTEKRIICYENMIILGGTLGNIWFVFQIPLHGTWILAALYGLCSGIYVGCLAMALAELLRLLPIFVNRLQIKEGFSLIVVSLAVGKMVGTLFQYFW